MSVLAQIQEILLKEWDPIGISGVPECLGEYDQYACEIYALTPLHSNDIAQYLMETRFHQMCLGSCSIQDEEWAVAEKLAALLQDARSGDCRA